MLKHFLPLRLEETWSKDKLLKYYNLNKTVICRKKKSLYNLSQYGWLLDLFMVTKQVMFSFIFHSEWYLTPSVEKMKSFYWLYLVGLWCWMPFSTIFQLYRGGKYYWWRKPEYLEKTTNLLQVTENFIT